MHIELIMKNTSGCIACHAVDWQLTDLFGVVSISLAPAKTYSITKHAVPSSFFQVIESAWAFL